MTLNNNYHLHDETVGAMMLAIASSGQDWKTIREASKNAIDTLSVYLADTIRKTMTGQVDENR
jgi:hypothetical protein